MHRLAYVTLALACADTQPRPLVPLANVGSDATTVAVVTAVAAGTYVAAGGCRIAGCAAHLACNPKSERCETIECDPRGPEACPPGSACSPAASQCRTVPLPQGPTP